MSQVIQLRLPDGTQKTFPKGTIGLEIAKSIGAGLAKAALAVKLNGKLKDLRFPIMTDCDFEVVTTKSAEANEVVRHSAEHVLADAVKRLWPKAQIDVGRSDHTEKFQYDIKIDHAFTEKDLEVIEAKAKEILKENANFVRTVVSRDEAKALFKNMNEMLKVSRIDDIPSEEDISLFKHGQFTDLCEGPHVQNTSQIGAFKLMAASASYWRGDEKNEKLQRIYGIAFSTQKELDAYLTQIEEAQKRDHRKLGKELDLFSVNDTVGPGLILWHPKGGFVRHLIEEFWRKEHLANGYDLVCSPHVARVNLWETSGHTAFYKDNMYAPIEVEEQKYMLKPMNCPFHVQIYKSSLRSYRDLPLRYAELGTVYRYERSGVLHGLLRVRGFTQDDAHLFVRPDDLGREIQDVLKFVIKIFKTFGFHEYEIFLSTRPEKSVGTDENWESATKALKEGIEALSLPYQVDPGEGVFYGPKIDIKIKDSIGRSWQCSTIQVDFNLPAAFGLEYVAEDGSRKAPIMVHRALLGSMERFFGCLIEHHSGAFPTWLSPVQAKVLPITQDQLDYGRKVTEMAKRCGIRIELDDRSEKLGFKVREAQMQKIPFMFVLGPKEKEENTISVRKRSGEQIDALPIEQAISLIQQEVQTFS